MRTQETHKSHIADLNGPLHDHIATTYGVSEESILNSSRYFHVADGMVPDIMHDILEGTAQVVLKCLLKHLMQDRKLFSFETLNSRIESFNYGPMDLPNKPSEISKSTFKNCDSLRQSGKTVHMDVIIINNVDVSTLASQAWCLCRFFPLMVGDMVEEGEDERWENFLDLLTVMEYVFAPILTVDKTCYLEMLIKEFLREFVRLTQTDHWYQKCTI